MSRERAVPFEIDRSLIGQEYDVTESEPVTREEIVAFARAVGETNPAYYGDEPIAPPSFCVRFRGKKFFHPKLPAEAFYQGFDAGKDVTLGVPIRAGDVVRSSTVLHDLYEKTGRSGTMVFVVMRQTETNQHGETIAVVDHRFVMKVRGEGGAA